MNTVRRWFAVVALIALAGSAATAQEEALARGAALLAPFKHDLKQALVRGLSDGAVQAVTVCRAQAPTIAQNLAKDGVRLGRTSMRLRNPENIAPAWVGPILQAYVEQPSERIARATALPDGRVGYVEPIFVQPMCLQCHGEKLSPEVAARINELYPQDHAVGFRAGDLRGAFWAEFPAAE